ncbi:MAG: energy transducer TonB [Candidatus Koribacter versatilis]|uniref:Energy transducer TonB n=1 Tax=Candidatus Korobacter versatilis TaxID=658062 RepID=A0A932A958_9BACT|nr:energy transducer TonB [Candidatus Koribacter versatilis]
MSSQALFGDVLLETTVAERRRRRLTLFATLSGEALVIAALVALPLLYLDAVPGMSVHAAPQMPVSFTPPMEMVGDPGQSGGRTIAIASPTDEYVVTRTMANPQLTYDRYRAASDEVVPPNTPLPPGCCGVGIGNNIAAIAPHPVLPAPPEPRRIISHLDAGMITHRVDPVYPPLARQTHVQGEVVLRATISKDGRIEAVQLLSGHPLLAAAAVNAVSQWRFRPYVLNGSPVEVEAQVIVNFTLGNQ